MNDISNDLISSTTLPVLDFLKKKSLLSIQLMGKDSVGVKGVRPTTDGWSSLEDFNKLYPFSSE